MNSNPETIVAPTLRPRTPDCALSPMLFFTFGTPTIYDLRLTGKIRASKSEGSKFSKSTHEWTDKLPASRHELLHKTSATAD